ncbi:DUF6173 family protein [Halalkalibacter nanhaiisediminis]|uniref:Uncharacterized protein n=1 Tax=Halalkalibacter nanhaiisediminis TaxID=688079 RepID=A0A562QR66_9BACI|nr:DUF6173 family protein [Halalkalibacter nanhaiisediminis]TWI59224.1 hypothetical protein IQ10_00937 [Halalkalibacter nanhaiisediminis]
MDVKNVPILNDINKVDYHALVPTNPELASQYYEKLVNMIREFEKNLDHLQEVGVRLVSFGQTIQFHIENIGYYDPSLIRFYGRLENGSRVELIQHVSQISFLLMAVKRLDPSKPKNKIGFLKEKENQDEKTLNK